MGLVALTAAIVLGSAATAQAQIPIGINLGLTVSAPYIEGVLTGQNQPLDAVGNLLCATGQSVGGNLPGGAPVSQALCAIPALDYQYVTRLKTSGGGEIVRRHAALVNVPTPLNVDGDLLPDVIATVHVLSLSEFTLRVDRFLTELGATPVKIEAIVDDPTAGALPRENINVGYDARESRAPSSWKATATLPDDGSDALTTLNLVKEVTGAGAAITTLGGLFDGDSLARKDPMGGAIRYTPVPPRATLGFTLGSYMEVRAGASVPVAARASAEIVDGPGEQRVAANVAALPQQVRVRLEEPGASERIVTYAGSAAVPALEATYTDSLGGTIATKVVAKASGLPTGMVLHQTGARAATFEATGGTVGSVEVGYANGEPRLLNVAHPYARVFDDGTLASYAGRIDALRSASIDATTQVAAKLVLGPDARKPLRALVDVPDGRRVDGVVSNLPRRLNVLYDADGGVIDYDAFGETIDDITLDAAQTAPFFDRVRRIHGRIEQLPPQATVNIKPDGGGLRLNTTSPIGKAEVVLTDGVATAPSLAAGRAGVIMTDVPSEFSLFGRLFNVSAASVTTAGANLDATLDTGPLPSGGGLQDLDLDVTFDTPGDAVTDPTRIVGFVQDVPAKLALAQHGATTTYSASTSVPKLTLDARNLPGGSSGGSLDGDLHNAVATLTGVPTKFTITSGLATGIEANGPFARADLEAWDHGPQNVAFPEDDRNKLTLDTRDARLHVQARVFALSKVLLTSLIGTTVETAFASTSAPLDMTVDGGTGADPLDLDVGVTDLPLSWTFEFSDLFGMHIAWTAESAGTDVTLKVAAKEVGADLSIPNLPSSVDVCVGGDLIACSPKSKQFVLVDPGVGSASTYVMFPNNFTAVTAANGTITMSGTVCLPPTDSDGEARNPPGTVYGTCLAGTAPNRIEIANLRLRNQRLEFAAGDSLSKDEDGEPIEDDLLKLYLQGDDGGIKVDELRVRNDTSQSTTTLRAGHTGGLPLRNSGDFFFGLFDLSLEPAQEDEPRINQIECSDLNVEVDLPLLGATDVLPEIGEELLGDLCI